VKVIEVDGAKVVMPYLHACPFQCMLWEWLGGRQQLNCIVNRLARFFITDSAILFLRPSTWKTKHGKHSVVPGNKYALPENGETQEWKWILIIVLF